MPSMIRSIVVGNALAGDADRVGLRALECLDLANVRFEETRVQLIGVSLIPL